jgi:hypothetical protein
VHHIHFTITVSVAETVMAQAQKANTVQVAIVNNA